MGILDALARRRGYVKPEDVEQKTVVLKRPRRVLQARSLDAAETSKMLYGWTTTPTHINGDLVKSWGAVVARARELAKNDDYVRRYMRVARNNILGATGIQLQAGVKGGDGNPDTQANDAIEAAWKRWSRRGVCDVSGRFSWREIQRTVVDSVGRDGEAIVELIPRGGPFAFQVRLHDPVTLPWDHNVAAGKGQRPERGNAIQMGVEYDRDDRAVAYHFRSSDPDQAGYYHTGGRGYVRVPSTWADGRPRILHIFHTEEVGQKRGLTGMASAVLRLKMLGGYEEATLVGARAGAAQMLFFQKEEGAEPEYTGDTTDADGQPIDEIEAGIVRTLPTGWSLAPYEPPQPSTQYVDFHKQTLRGIAAGLGISYHTLANDLEAVNYSSARVGVMEDREEWKGAQVWIIEALCEPTYPFWLEQSLLAQQILINGQAVGLNRLDRFSQVHWMPRRWAWVDPLKDMQAAKLGVGIRTQSISSIIRESGGDPDEVFREIQREREQLDAMGIPPDDAMEEIVTDAEE